MNLLASVQDTFLRWPNWRISIGGFLRNLGGDIERQVSRTRSRDSSDVAVVVEAIHELLLSKVTGNRRTQTRFLQGSKMG
ncbi:hypothetical protein QQ045_007658 [Rhodiola kirilowii]